MHLSTAFASCPFLHPTQWGGVEWGTAGNALECRLHSGAPVHFQEVTSW